MSTTEQKPPDVQVAIESSGKLTGGSSTLDPNDSPQEELQPHTSEEQNSKTPQKAKEENNVENVPIIIPTQPNRLQELNNTRSKEESVDVEEDTTYPVTETNETLETDMTITEDENNPSLIITSESKEIFIKNKNKKKSKNNNDLTSSLQLDILIV